MTFLRLSTVSSFLFFLCNSLPLSSNEILSLEKNSDISITEAEPKSEDVLSSADADITELNSTCEEQTNSIEAIEKESRVIREERRKNYNTLGQKMVASILKKFPARRFPRICAAVNKLLYGNSGPDNADFYDIEALDRMDARALGIGSHMATWTKQWTCLKDQTEHFKGLIYVPLHEGNDTYNLYSICQNSDELSGVMAHETAHLHQYHIVKAMILAYGIVGYLYFSDIIAHFLFYAPAKMRRQVDPEFRAKFYDFKRTTDIAVIVGAIPALFAIIRHNEYEADAMSIAADPRHAPALTKTFLRLELASLLWKDFIKLQPATNFEKFDRALGEVLQKTLGKVFRTHPSHTQRIKIFLRAWIKQTTDALETSGMNKKEALAQAKEQVSKEYVDMVASLTTYSVDEVKQVMLSTFGLAITVKRPLQRPMVFDQEIIQKLYEKQQEYQQELLKVAA